MQNKLTKSVIAASLVAFTATGCADMNATQRGTAQGAGIGAALRTLAPGVDIIGCWPENDPALEQSLKAGLCNTCCVF